MSTPDNAPHDALRRHVTGKVQAGEAEPITEEPATCGHNGCTELPNHAGSHDDGTWDRPVPCGSVIEDPQYGGTGYLHSYTENGYYITHSLTGGGVRYVAGEPTRSGTLPDETPEPETAGKRSNGSRYWRTTVSTRAGMDVLTAARHLVKALDRVNARNPEPAARIQAALDALGIRPDDVR